MKWSRRIGHSCLGAGVLLAVAWGQLQAQTGPFLWKIEGQSPSYLFGTIHLPDKRVTRLPAPVERAFQSSDAVFTEVPLDAASMTGQIASMMLPGQQTLSHILPADLLERSEKALQDVNPALTLQPLQRFKVWALATMLTVLDQQLKNPGQLPLDARLYQRAESENKTLGSLETPQEQMDIFDSMRQDEQVKMLRDTLDFIDDAKARGQSVSEEMIQWYLKGDIQAFGEFLMSYVTEDAFYDALFERLLHDRNRLMADRIASEIAQHPGRGHFFAVGAGHFWGETAIQRLLRAKGLKVERVGNQVIPYGRDH